jgi:hypothetical protein
MFLKLLFILSFAIYNLNAYEDLGTYGEMYEIKEKDFMETLTEKYNKLDIKKIENQITNNASKSLIIKSRIGSCLTTRTREYEPVIKLENDLKLPYLDNVLEKKGIHNILKENKMFIPYNIIFIDADDEIQIELAKLYKKVLKEKIRILIVKGDYLKITQNSLFQNAKVARDAFEIKAFNVQCLPSIYTQKEYKFIINEYNPKELIKNEKK